MHAHARAVQPSITNSHRMNPAHVDSIPACMIHAMIHPTAIVHPGAQARADVEVGAYTSSASMSRSGRHAHRSARRDHRPHPHRSGNRIFQFVSLGEIPQDKKYGGEPTRLEIGDHNTIREFCTFNIGTVQDVGVTRVGNDNWIMAYVHLAHDCQVGSHTVLANRVQLAGHVAIGDYVILGGGTMVHQFCRVGAHAFTAGGSIVLRDVPPYVMAAAATPRSRTASTRRA